MNQPNNHREELSHFNVGGKTFFFNVREAKNGTKYLAMTALYGKQRGNYEKLVLFPAHYLEFFKHLKGAIEELESIKLSGDAPTEPVEPCPERCPNCDWYLREPDRNV